MNIALKVKVFQHSPIWIMELISEMKEAGIKMSVEITPNKKPSDSYLEKFYNRYGRYNTSCLFFTEIKPFNIEISQDNCDEILDLTGVLNRHAYQINLPFETWSLSATLPRDAMYIELSRKSRVISSKVVGVINTDRVITSKIQLALHIKDLIFSYFTNRVIYKSDVINNANYSSFLKGLWIRVFTIIKAKLTYANWKVKLVEGNNHYRLSEANSKDLLADPFLWKYNDELFCFYEEQTQKQPGVIKVFGVRNKTSELVIQEKYHLSYPQLIQDGEDLLMIPESSANSTLDIYKCLQFPNKWKKVHTMFSGRKLHDATILKHEGKYWLFAVECSDDRMNPWVDLKIFYADSLYAEWKSHAMNPVLSDVRYARCGGSFLRRDNEIIRVCQNSSGRYGRNLSFRKVIELTADKFREEEYEMPLEIREKNTAMHTYNEIDPSTYVYDYIR